MSDLHAMQTEFMAHVLEEERDLPEGWTERHKAGMAIYRGGYRARMVETLGEAYERTGVLAREDAFRQAAINHVIARPPSGWSIDSVGAEFHETLSELYPDRPDLAELAQLEDLMQKAARAADASALTVEQFSQNTAAFGEQDWADLRFEFLLGLAILAVTHDWVSVWGDLGGETDGAAPQALDDEGALVIWREDEQPVFAAISKLEAIALTAMQTGSNFGETVALLAEEIGAEAAAAQAGGMIGNWLQMGFVADLASPRP
ncbi:HvfC/BufC family peptide modification chaperone [Erythrobacter sp. W53]|uniref:HvfC/BufC family peptide modification chaperone n=1 Tax=Erythrobacter sp. W53 TaxID=3425947 RepID=UPI003D76673C